MARTHTLADGQLAASAGTILAGTSIGNDPVRVGVVIHNTGSATETVVVTMQRSGGTARRVARAVLNTNESLVINGLPVQTDDTLLGVTTTAEAVDYVVYGSNAAALSIDVLSADGTSKGVATLRKMLAGIQVLVGSELADPGE